MGMTFTVDVTGDIEVSDIEVTDSNFNGLDAESVLSDNVFSPSRVSFENAEVVGGSVSISATIRIEGIEVAVGDLSDYDAESAIDEVVDATVRNADFDITDSPTGFEAVEAELDRDTAITVYAALDAAGFSVV